MKAEIITIGDELLIGQVIDTNSAWIARELNMVGIAVAQITSISDDHEHIIKTLNEATERADIIIMTGGLGPTRDDITKIALCDYFKTHLIFDPKSFENIERIFTIRGYAMTDVNRKQAEVPAACEALLNVNGTAPGMLFRHNGRIYISLPGVPFEMKALMTDHVLPLLKPLSGRVIMHKTILTQGVGESFLADKIKDWESALPQHIKLAYLPQPGIVRLRLSAFGTSEETLLEELTDQVNTLYSLIHEYIFGEDEDNLESIIGKLLKDYNLKLATAESCTGGYIAHLITSVPGSSAYFEGSIISYSNEVKINSLGVKQETLDEYGAVSKETVIEMAEGVMKRLNANCAIAVSGIAGPDGGTNDKPVGTVWIAVTTPYTGTVTKKFLFGEHRERNIRRSALAALDLLRKQLIYSA
ncbi:MAG: competence/damage-inducible protein A [Chloroflexota bacterium]|nr:competence/damage-inducible protein A [Lentimicrobium sp.]